MVKFIMTALLGTCCAFYAGVFLTLAALQQSFIPDQQWYAVALLVAGFLFPVLGYVTTTTEEPARD